MNFRGFKLSSITNRYIRTLIDWIFGTPDLNFSALEIPQSLASDHLPVGVTVTWAN